MATKKHISHGWQEPSRRSCYVRKGDMIRPTTQIKIRRDTEPTAGLREAEWDNNVRLTEERGD